MRRFVIAVLLAAVGCECYLSPPIALSSISMAPSKRSAAISMAAKRKNAVSRREVVDGSSLTKQFYDPDGFRADLPVGWSPALVVLLGAGVSSFGGSVRSKLFDELRELSSGAKNQGSVSHLPVVSISRGRTSGQVSVEITAASAQDDDAIDYVWAADADTGEIFAGRKFSKSEAASLLIVVDRGRRIVPSVHWKRDGTWEGEAIVANA